MHLICSHEQADFDAVASLVGVKVLDPQAVAVLPRRLNRNVRAYLTLYGSGYDLFEFDEVPKGSIERLTLVDTQSAPSVKGMSGQTKIFVIDHHPLSESIDPSWSTHVEEVGATVTLLIEEIVDRGLEIDYTTATLLLLGIYEDTGSLTYASTTVRDLRACTWLLEHGASLRIAAEFLDHPLSNGQRELYEQLIESAESYDFHGVSVIIACANASGVNDEISTLAHKLRDVFDPDGLFVLVALDSNVQLIARSTGESLDVGDIAAHFGGGGHTNASAALIRKKGIEDVCEELKSFLDQTIAPPVRVHEIMSRDPHLLDPNEKISSAADRIRQYGHEGYPVVKDGEVQGLLTRRAVDRAMSHGMGNQPVNQIMESGDLVINADDSIQSLQRVMIETGWGQIPVRDPKRDEIIGIVTRTDLISAIGIENDRIHKPALKEKLEAALPSARLALLRAVSEEAEAHGDALYIVGGFVRDLLLGSPSVDFDLVVEGDAIGLAKDLVSKYGGRVSSHRRFGTAKWHLDQDSDKLKKILDRGAEGNLTLPSTLDFVTARAEFYTHPTALPSVRRGSIKLDLHRRDFTINTLAIRLDGRHFGQLLDHWGGGRDLEHGLIRVLHSISFVDDPTRILRAIRLEKRLGFNIEDRTYALLRQAIPLLDRVSGERILHEITSIFNEPKFDEMLTSLHQRDLLSAIHPALCWDEWLEGKFILAHDLDIPADWNIEADIDFHTLWLCLWCFRLEKSQAEEVCQRLRLSMTMKDDILNSNDLGHRLSEGSHLSKPSEIVAVFDDYSETTLVSVWIALEHFRDQIVTYLTDWRNVKPVSTGDDLREMKLPPGPEYGQILWSLRAAWLDGDISEPREEKALLEQMTEGLLRNG